MTFQWIVFNVKSIQFETEKSIILYSNELHMNSNDELNNYLLNNMKWERELEWEKMCTFCSDKK